MTLDDFVTRHSGETLSFDGVAANRGQCVQLVEYYIVEVLGLKPFWGDAIVWFDKFGGSLAGAFDKVVNDKNNPAQVPSRGDIIVWSGSLPNSGGAGHIAIVLETHPGDPGFTSFDSNWSGKYAHKVSHNWQYVVGWLHLKGGSNMKPNRGQIASIWLGMYLLDLNDRSQYTKEQAENILSYYEKEPLDTLLNDLHRGDRRKEVIAKWQSGGSDASDTLNKIKELLK